jgi:hypothetical protein
LYYNTTVKGSSNPPARATGGRGKRREKKSLLLATVKFEPTFFHAVWQFLKSAPVGGRNSSPNPSFRPPYSVNSVRILSYIPSTVGQLGFSAKIRQPLLVKNSNFLPCRGRTTPKANFSKYN